MNSNVNRQLSALLKGYEEELSQDWIQEQLAIGIRQALISDIELREDCKEFLDLFLPMLQQGNTINIYASEWVAVREFLSDISRTRTQKGFSPAETATFIFSLKQPLFKRIQQKLDSDATLIDEIWSVSLLLDKLGLFTMETYQRVREEIIIRQQEELIELSTPVVKLWDGILALPIIGTLDSTRTQVVMESLLNEIQETGSAVAIIDITGVPTVDTLTAQHLLKTITAARLMGAECFISGMRPQIAQTIVYLGVDLENVVTKASLADAFALALRRVNLGVTRLRPRL
jgi:rsbT co-antagonist protein RsbR